MNVTSRLKKILFFSIVLIYLLLIQGCATINEMFYTPPAEDMRDFRNVSWGMSKREVKAYERKPLTEGEEYLAYFEIRFGFSLGTLSYLFLEDKLILGYYKSAWDYSEKTSDKELIKVSEDILPRYGPPNEKKRSLEIVQALEEMITMGEKNGKIVRALTWETPKTVIVLSLRQYDSPMGLKYDVKLSYFMKEIMEMKENYLEEDNEKIQMIY